jgi:hypothetical protein
MAKRPRPLKNIEIVLAISLPSPNDTSHEPSSPPTTPVPACSPLPREPREIPCTTGWVILASFRIFRGHPLWLRRSLGPQKQATPQSETRENGHQSPSSPDPVIRLRLRSPPQSPSTSASILQSNRPKFPKKVIIYLHPPRFDNSSIWQRAITQVRQPPTKISDLPSPISDLRPPMNPP